tara:strand:+ start:1229 stop:1453 length:225 start_codon:yes stop_codon:yes gene_type:complete
MKKMVNGEVFDMTQDDINEMERDLAIANQEIQDRETAKIQKANDQASGNQKLLDLGLTQAEATALTGYTPPVEE